MKAELMRELTCFQAKVGEEHVEGNFEAQSSYFEELSISFKHNSHGKKDSDAWLLFIL